MSMITHKRIAAQILKCGVTRIKIKSAKEVEEALTRNDIRDLIKKGVITKIQKKGTTKAYSKVIKAQKKKGRRKYDGSKKGAAGARTYFKGLWINKVRPLRRMLKELKDADQIERKDYAILYSRIKGGFFRDKKHLMNYLKDNKMLKGKKAKKTKNTQPAKKKKRDAKKERRKTKKEIKRQEAKRGKK
ncbi:MAG: 50S ribosomal protein L19e [Candidatus Aenigmatarchaeota archaeon]|nr:50S ribosomal protein L19e [Nanoarchaeota archaeon]